MKDTELRAMLVRLGMPPAKANEATRQIRDVLHPVAAAAASKMVTHQNALESFATYGEAGLSGYDYDELSGLFSNVKKAVKSVANTAVKVVKPVAAIVAAPVTGGASVALLAADMSRKAGKKATAEQVSLATTGLSKKENKIAVSGKGKSAVPYAAMDAASLASEEARLRAMIASGKDRKGATAKLQVLAKFQAQSIPAALPSVVSASPAPVLPQPGVVAAPAQTGRKPSWFRGSAPKTPPTMNDPQVPQVTEAADAASESISEQLVKRRHVRVPREIGEASGQVAAQAVAQGYPSDPATLLQAMMANAGTNMVSPAAQEVVRTVASEGVEKTPAGPSSLPSWALPAAIAGGGLLLVAMLGRGRK